MSKVGFSTLFLKLSDISNVVYTINKVSGIHCNWNLVVVSSLNALKSNVVSEVQTPRFSLNHVFLDQPCCVVGCVVSP